MVWDNAAIGNPQGSFRAIVLVENVYDQGDFIPNAPNLLQVPAAGGAPAPQPHPQPVPGGDRPGSFSNGRCEIPFSETATNNAVARLYRAYFNRTEDAGGQGHWVPKYRSGQLCLTETTDFFAQSNEFISTYGALGNPQFVRLVYVNVLGREPDPEGYNFWAQRITFGGVSRGTMMVGFSESPEFRSRTGLA